MNSAFVTVISAALLVPLYAAAAESTARNDSTRPLLEKFDRGHINWQSGEYVANVSAPVPSQYRGKPVNLSMGKELALRVSGALADSVFLQIVADTRVDAEHRLSQLVKSDSEIKLAGNIRGKKLIKQRWVERDNKLWLDASYRISMRGVDGVISNIYNQAIATRPVTPSSPENPSASRTGMEKSDTENVIYIDARGTGLQPALFPCIMDKNNDRLFDPADAGKPYIAENGVVEYVVETGTRPISELLNIKNAIYPPVSLSTISPQSWLITAASAEETNNVRKRKKRNAVKAEGAEGLLKSNIIVGTEDAEKLRKAQESGDLPGNPRIVVITDGTIGGTEGRLIGNENHWASLSL